MSKPKIERFTVAGGTIECEMALAHGPPDKPQPTVLAGMERVWVRVVTGFSDFPSRWFVSSERSYHRTQEQLRRDRGPTVWMQADAWQAEAEALRLHNEGLLRWMRLLQRKAANGCRGEVYSIALCPDEYEALSKAARGE